MMEYYFKITKVIFAISIWGLSVALAGGVKTPDVHNTKIRFTENKNQWDNGILYRASLDGGALFLRKNDFTYNFYDAEALRQNHIQGSAKPIKGHAFRMTFVGANAEPVTKSKNPSPDYCNFYIGNNPSKWASNVKNYTEVYYENLYQNIDFQVMGFDNSIKYNFYVAPMADASSIQLLYEGLDNIALEQGKLKLKTSINEMVEQKPYAYQWINGKRIDVACEFKLTGTTISFNFPRGYDKAYELVIDPVLIFAASSGSTADNFGMTATYDSQGHLYSGGTVFGQGFPFTLGAYDITYNGIVAYGRTDVVITKYSPNGASLIYSTYLGGANNTETVHSLVVNSQDELFLFGVTGSNDFPIKAGAYDNTFNGGTKLTFINNGTYFDFGTDIYLAKFNIAGTSLLASTYLGGSLNDGVNTNNDSIYVASQLQWEFPVDSLQFNYGDQYRGEINVDLKGDVYVSSSSRSANFPIVNGLDNTRGGKQDAVVFKFNSNLSQLMWSTYLGGSDNDAGFALAIDDSLDVYVTGGTRSSNFPTTVGAFQTIPGGGKADGYITKIKKDGTSILNSTYIGTLDYDQSYFVQIDKDDDIYILGQTEGNIPISSGVYNNPGSGQFLWKLNKNLTSSYWSTRFGDGTGVAVGKSKVNISPSAFLVDDCKNIYVSGWGGKISTIWANSVPTTGMPTTSNAFQQGTDGYNFYLAVFTPNATSLYYATYFGGNQSQEHVDGGTSRFDKKGIVYQSVCAGCGGKDDFPVTPGAWPYTASNYSPSTGINMSTNCNNGTFKFDFQVPLVDAQYTVNNSSGCTPLTVQFSNQSTAGSNYTWIINPGNIIINTSNPSYTFTAPGTYTVCLYVNNASTCNINDTACGIITVYDSINADFDFTTVPCSNLVAFSDSSKVGPTSWSWDFDDGNSSTSQNPSHTYGTGGNYDVTLIASNQWGCKDTVTYQVSVPIPAAITVSPNAFICLGNSTQLNASGGFSYSWVPTTGLNNANIANPIATPTVTTTYTVNIQTINSLGDTCMQSASVTVNVFNPATYTLTATADDDTLTDGETGTFIHAITADTSFSVTWSPSNTLNNDTIYNPYATPTTTTTYTVTIADSSGCSKTATITIYVISKKCPPESVFVPNTFTPNMDGKNDILYVRGNNIKELYFAVYNRWGEMVFETTDINKGWDGIYDGMKADPAVFAWYLKATCLEGTEIKRKGNTTLIR